MQAGPGREVDLAAEQVGKFLLQLRELDQAEIAGLVVVDEEIDVAVLARFPASDGAEQVERGRPERLDLGFVRFELCDDGFGSHV